MQKATAFCLNEYFRWSTLGVPALEQPMRATYSLYPASATVPGPVCTPSTGPVWLIHISTGS